MICLGIESTAHTFSIGIMQDKEVLASIDNMYKPKKGGLVPRELMQHHVDIAKQTIAHDFCPLAAFSSSPDKPKRLSNSCNTC